MRYDRGVPICPPAMQLPGAAGPAAAEDAQSSVGKWLGGARLLHGQHVLKLCSRLQCDLQKALRFQAVDLCGHAPEMMFGAVDR